MRELLQEQEERIMQMSEEARKNVRETTEDEPEAIERELARMEGN